MSQGTVIITGGTRGLGRDLSLVFGRNHFSVVALYQKNHKAREALEALFRHEGLQGTFLSHDLLTSTAFPEVPLSGESVIFIHNACAFFEPIPIKDLSFEAYELQFQMAMKGAFLGLQRLLKPMIQKKKGVMASILSKALHGAPKGFSAYLCAKASLKMFMQTASSEFSSLGLQFHCYYPGFMETDLTGSWAPRLQDYYRGNKPIPSTAEVASQIFQKIDFGLAAGISGFQEHDV